MDAVEVPLPAAAVAGSKLLGSESFESVGVIDRCNSLSGQKGAGAASESVSWVKIPDNNVCLHASGPSIFSGENVSKELCTEGTDCFVLSTSRSEVKELQLKAGKVSRSSSGFAKRLQATQMEESPSDTGDNRFSKLELSITERTQVVKQRNNLIGKRGDKRNSKVMRSKYDTSLKSASLNVNTAAGGSSIFGVYGLKSDFVDVTKQEEELPLDVLLDGSYKHTNVSKDQGRKAANFNESFLQSVRKASSILQFRRPVCPQGFPENDNWLSKKASSFPMNSSPCTTSSLGCDKGDTYCADPAPFGKIEDLCSKPEVPSNNTAAPSYEPKDVLERLALPPPMDLESLLVDSAKRAVSSRNTIDTRSGKQISRQISLPPFPWSHASGGHCKVNSDAAKSSTSRSTCQVRWVRIGNPTSSVRGVAPCYVDLESLTFDHNLVPSVGQKLGFSGNQNTQTEQDPSYASCSRALQVPPGDAEIGGCVKNQEDDVHSPRARAAAQVLYDIVIHPPRLNPQGVIRWMKKPPSQGAINARRPKSKERPEEMFTRFDTAAGVLLESDDDTTHFKRLKHSTQKKKDPGLAKTIIKAPMSWSTPRSSRSSPIIKPLKESLAEMKHFTATPKHSSRDIPSARSLDKACNSQQKLRRLVPMDWSRAKGKLE